MLFFPLWTELCPELAHPSGPLYQQLLEKVLICTLPKIWVYQSESPIWCCLCPSQVKPREWSQIQQARRHRGYLQSSRNMAWGLSGTWCCQEYACADEILSSGRASAQQHLSSEGCSWLEPSPGPDPQCPQGLTEGHKLEVFTPSHCHWKSQRLLKITVFTLIQLYTAMPLKPAKISLIRSCCFHHADTLQVVHPQRIPIIKHYTFMSQETQKAAKGQKLCVWKHLFLKQAHIHQSKVFTREICTKYDLTFILFLYWWVGILGPSLDSICQATMKQMADSFSSFLHRLLIVKMIMSVLHSRLTGLIVRISMFVFSVSCLCRGCGLAWNSQLPGKHITSIKRIVFHHLCKSHLLKKTCLSLY